MDSRPEDCLKGPGKLASTYRTLASEDRLDHSGTTPHTVSHIHTVTHNCIVTDMRVHSHIPMHM